MNQSTVIQRALISVTDKTGIVEFASALHNLGIEIISTGGTAKALQDQKIPVVDISKYTGFPEMMDGRLKSLHPKIYGGILGRRDEDVDVMSQHNIQDIDLVVVNLYQFKQTVSSPDVKLAQAIEKIDIGGPTLIRAAAKNFKWCTVVTSPQDYETLLQELKPNKQISQDSRFKLAQKAFKHTAEYDGHISNYLSSLDKGEQPQIFSETLNSQYDLKQVLRYGENPHQQAAFYQSKTPVSHSLAHAEQIQGKELSYNNILDGEAAIKCVKRFDEPCCVIVKHTNPCGAAVAENLNVAYDKAFACDPQSAFGGIVAFNKTVDDKLMDTILSNQFVEMIIAPSFNEAAIQLAQSKPNCRLLATQDYESQSQTEFEIKSIRGGLLVQTPADQDTLSLEVVTKIKPSEQQLADLKFAWQVIKSVKSNAIVLAQAGQTLGIGAGQTSRVFSLEIAKLRAQQANLTLKGSVLASDAFFPFKDSVELAHAMGVSAIIQPGGSKRDPEVIETANALGIAMVFTHTRQFLH